MRLPSLFPGVLIGALVFVVSCAENDEQAASTGRDTTAPEVRVSVVAAHGARISSKDGRVSLLVPAGALERDAEVTLTVRSGPGDALTDEYTFEPSELGLVVEASLVFQVSPPVEAGATIARREADQTWQRLNARSDGTGQASVNVARLGTYALVSGGQR